MADALAPIAVFAYHRSEHLARTLAWLRANPEASDSDVYVFCDGAKTAADAPLVDAVREQVARLDGFASVTRVERPVNLGLAKSIVGGVTEVLSRHDRVIVLEDDLVLSPHFLRYMNDALACYRDDENVASIHGYAYPTPELLPPTFFLRGADCWGWATWRRGWAHFRPDGAALLAELKSRKLTHEFDLDGAYPFTRMLEDQVAGRNDSWAVRWHASCFLANLLTLYPGRSLVDNIGMDSSGTHCVSTNVYSQSVTGEEILVKRVEAAESAQGRAAFAEFLAASRGSWSQRVGRALRRVANRHR